MKKKNKFYVVWSGKKTGIFHSWDECKKQIHGVEKAQYKSFKTQEEAENAFKKSYFESIKTTKNNSMVLTEQQKLKYGTPDLNTISVDAACSGNPGIMEYQGVDTKTKEVLFKMGPYKNSTNNIGEFLALVHALSAMKQQNDNRAIYSDSRTAMAWVRNKKVKTVLKRSPNNENSFALVDRAVQWLENNHFNNQILKWETKVWGEIPADFGRK